MSFTGKIKSWFGPAAPALAPPPPRSGPEVVYVPVPEARYEGSYQYWGERSLIPATLQDAIRDATPGVRCELARRSRYWERNSAVMQRLADLFEQFTVGPGGLRLIPNAGADEPATKPKEAVREDGSNALDLLGADPVIWNKIASDWWADWCRQPEIDSLRSYGEMMSLVARTWFVDGEVFLLKTADNKGRPRIQLIEGHRVGTPTDMTSFEGTTIIDGVEVNAAGAPVAYHVRQSDTSALQAIGNTLYPYISTTPQEYKRIPADRMIHVFEAVRPGMTRGLPFNYAVLNDLHDFEDLQREEMAAVKSAADLANVWHTKTGEPVNSSNFRGVQRNIQSQDAAGNPAVKSSRIYYDMTQGGRDKYLMPGEDVKQFLTERPTVSTQWFYDYLLSKICAGVGISKLLVMPYSNQGTVVRSDLDVNARFFLSRSAVLARVASDLYVWALGWAKDWDRRFVYVAAPPTWFRVIVRPPRSVNVDIGRNSQAMLAELQAAVRNYATIFAESGEDWKEETEQSFKEAAFFKQMEAKYGVAKSEVIMLPKSPAPQPAPAAPAVKASSGDLLPLHTNGNGNGHSHYRFSL